MTVEGESGGTEAVFDFSVLPGPAGRRDPPGHGRCPCLASLVRVADSGAAYLSTGLDWVTPSSGPEPERGVMAKHILVSRDLAGP